MYGFDKVICFGCFVDFSQLESDNAGPVSLKLSSSEYAKTDEKHNGDEDYDEPWEKGPVELVS